MAAVARGHGADPYTAMHKAQGMLNNMVNAQALMLTFNQIFKLVAIIVLEPFLHLWVGSEIANAAVRFAREPYRSPART